MFSHRQDFDVNSMIDKNLQMSYLIVDEMHNEHPELLKDQYWDEVPSKLLDQYQESEDSDETPEPSDVVDFDTVQRSSNIFRRRSAYTESKSKGGETKDAELGSSEKRVRRKLKLTTIRAID
jgi:small-conductance mechanosensitive channel